MKRKIGFLSLLVLSCVFSSRFLLTVNASTIPPYVETPEEGEYKMGGESGVTEEDGHLKLGTDFYIYIENPVVMESPLIEETTESNPNPITPPAAPLGSSSETETANETEAPNETEATNETQASKNSGSLPKTGDYGLDKNGFLFASLLFGAGYLVCDSYEKKNEKKK